MNDNQPTQQQLADKYGIGLSTIKRYKNAGIDIYDEEAVKEYQKNLPECNLNYYSDLDNMDVAELKVEKLRYETGIKKYDEIVSRFEAEQLQGKLVDLATIKESAMNIGTQVKAQLKAQELTLPPMLEGLTAKEMQKIIREYNAQIIKTLYEGFNIENDE